MSTPIDGERITIRTQVVLGQTFKVVRETAIHTNKDGSETVFFFEVVCPNGDTYEEQSFDKEPTRREVQAIANQWFTDREEYEYAGPSLIDEIGEATAFGYE